VPWLWARGLLTGPAKYRQYLWSCPQVQKKMTTFYQQLHKYWREERTWCNNFVLLS
jgi:hypothetical protein